MMKNILQIIFLLLINISCSQNLKDTKTSKEYNDNLSKKSLEDIKNQLKSDTVFLNRLLKDTTFNFRLVSHFSFGEKQEPAQSVPEFSINYDIPKMKELFNEYGKNLNFEQLFRENYSKDEVRVFGKDQFSFNSRMPENDSAFEELKSNISFTEKLFFHQGKPLEIDEIGLKRIDSIYTDIQLKIPVAFEKLSISQNQKNLKYNDFEIEVESIRENMAKIIVPVNLYQKIIGFQAFNKEGKRMNSGSFSANSVIAIGSEIKKELKNLHEIITKILIENDESKAKLLIKEINQKQFEAKNNMAEFSDYLEELLKEKRKLEKLEDDIGLYEDIAKKGKKVIATENQLLVIDFPDDIKSIDVFVGTQFSDLKQQKNIKYNPKVFLDEQNPNIIYYNVVKGNDLKYGIIDKNGKKIIEAKYKKIQPVGNDYFQIDEKLHWLDKNSNNLVLLPGYSNYFETVKPGYDILEKNISETTLQGLVKNQKEIIIPFEYILIENYGKFLVAQKEYGKKLDIFDENFKKLQNDEIHRLHLVDNFISTTIPFPKLFTVENSANKKALMNLDLQFLTPFKYEFITPFFEINNYYIVGIRTKNGSKYLFGLINEKGEEVTPLMFCNILNDLENGKIKYCLNDKKSTLSLSDFLNTYKK